jgi:hypothetical protein
MMWVGSVKEHTRATDWCSWQPVVAGRASPEHDDPESKLKSPLATEAAAAWWAEQRWAALAEEVEAGVDKDP